MTKPLADRIALVTGASRGIGAATALALGRAGAHVVAVARTVGGLEEIDDAIRADGGSATLVPLDLKEYAGIDRLGGALHQRYGRLDILIGNAGILGPLSPLGHVEPKAWDEVFAVNVTANWRLIRAMDPLLQASAAGRAVFITSGAAWIARAYWGPYAISKAALQVLARTRMRAQAMPGEDPAKLDKPHQVAEKILQLCLPSFMQTGKLYDYRTKALMEFRPPAPNENANQ